MFYWLDGVEPYFGSVHNTVDCCMFDSLEFLQFGSGHFVDIHFAHLARIVVEAKTKVVL